MFIKRKQAVQTADPSSHIFIDPSHGYSFSVDENRIHEWTVTFFGPPDTPYEGAQYTILIRYDRHDRFRAPEIFFCHKIWHANVCPDTGRVLASFLGAGFSPFFYHPETFALTVQVLLGRPQFCIEYRQSHFESVVSSYDEYAEKAREWKRKYAHNVLLESELIERNLACAMARHSRLGEHSILHGIDNDVFSMILDYSEQPIQDYLAKYAQRIRSLSTGVDEARTAYNDERAKYSIG